MGRKLLSFGVFPLLFFGGLFAAWSGLSRGIPPGLVVVAVTLVAGLVVLLVERVHPYLPEWNRARGDVKTDLWHALFSTALVPEVFKLLSWGLLLSLSARLSLFLGGSLWPSTWPIWCQLPLALVVAEFGQYWVHRLSHETELLWRLHATHHSPNRLYWLNAGRFHPLDTLVQYAAEVIPLVILGAGVEVLTLFTVATVVHGFLQHSNIDLRLGPLNWVFSMAELHRWHHSRTLEEANKNYGSNLILWDIVFRTRFLPSERKPPRDIGLFDMPDFPTTYTGQILSPFRWRKLRERGEALRARK